MRQQIKVVGCTLSILFDNGFGQMVIKKSAVDKLAKYGRAKQTIKGPLEITGVGDNKTVSEFGEYAICLPLHSGEEAVLSGVCLPKLTGDFPRYELKDVEEDIHDKCRQLGGDQLVSHLPKLPSVVDGGDVDILIGSRYLRYFPKIVHRFETGLSVFESFFKNTDGSRGVLNGPHQYFEMDGNKNSAHIGNTSYFLSQVWEVEKDIPLLTVKDSFASTDLDDCDSEFSRPCAGCFCSSHFENTACAARKIGKKVRRFEAIEHAGSDVTYRCVDCRSCKKCKNGPRVEAISIQEELE